MPSERRFRLTHKSIKERATPHATLAQVTYFDTEVRSLGLRVGRTARTWIVQRDALGRTQRIKIGRYPDWSPDAARIEARKIVVRLDQGEDVQASRRVQRARGVTFREAIALHIARLRAKGGSERSVVDIEYDTQHYLGDWLDRPLAELGRTDCRQRHSRITKRSGPYVANRAFRHVRAVYNTALREHEALPANPCIAVNWNRERRRQEPIPWADLPAWHECVLALSPVRRDYNLVVLFTGLRATDAATIRWRDVDLEAATLHRPKPKGGRAFTVPIAAHVVAILKRRRAENAIEFGPQGGDGGWAFPCVVRRGPKKGEVKPLSDPKQQAWREGRKVIVLPTPHRLRDTFATAAIEAGVDPYTLQTLLNHRPPTGSVTAGYVRPSVEHLREAVERITAFLLERTTH